MAKIYEQIIRYIDKNLKEELTLDQIAKAVGYSKFHIYKLFSIYTTVPVMKFVRRKKIYAAVNEFYTGQNLYEIALDYNYGTPAGFYKAFKDVFGCSPSNFKKHKLNDSKEILFMLIENVKTTEELDNVLAFAQKLYPESIEADGGGRYSRAYWLDQFNKQPELILYAKDGDKICGIALGCVDWGKNITVGGDGVLDEYKNKGVHEAMFIEIEKRGTKFGYEGIGLGIEDGQEEFYAKLGYVGKMLIQSEKHSVDELKNFFEINFKHKKECEITGSGVWDGYVNQLWLNVPILDKEIKSKFEKELEGCWTQIIVNKGL